MGWIFQESDPMGGAAGEAYANTLKSQGMQPEHVLAREAIQNSVDAGIEGKKVRVVFRHALLKGAAKADFVKASALTEVEARRSELDFSAPNCMQTLAEARKALSLLYVEDYNAEGLTGDPHDKNSNFYRLLLSLGDRSKSRTARGTGGSYGFGKSVYSSSSAIQTLFAYTRFKNEGGVEESRVFGCGYYKSHEHKQKSFSGRAWFGARKANDSAGRLIVDPLRDQEADKLAAKLGFHPRVAGECGTTILIIDATPDLQSVVAGVEDWWWPRLIENKVDVEIYDAAGALLAPRPRKRDHLRPFIEAFEIARGRATPKPGSQKLSSLNKMGDMALGVCGFVVAPLTEQGTPTVRPEWCNAVALVRAPLMVVAYRKCSETAPTVLGTFVAAGEVDSVLRKSEPPAHDRWDPDSQNLRDADDAGRKIVEAVLHRIRDHLRRFQREAAPPAPPKQKRLSILERALGSYFRPQGGGPQVQPDAVSSFLHLEFSKQPHAVSTPDGMLKLCSAFAVFLDHDAPDEDVELRMRLGCPVLEDDGQEGDDLALSVKVSGVKAEVDPEDKHVYRFQIGKGTKAKFAVESESYDAAWTVRLRPEIDAEVGK